MDNKRAGLNFDDDEPMDLSQFTGNKVSSNKTISTDVASLTKVAEASGFTSRQPRRRRSRKRSPYTIQTNVKTRDGMKELLQEASDRLGMYDQETFELAIESLLEKHNMQDLLAEYNRLLDR